MTEILTLVVIPFVVTLLASIITLVCEYFVIKPLAKRVSNLDRPNISNQQSVNVIQKNKNNEVFNIYYYSVIVITTLFCSIIGLMALRSLANAYLSATTFQSKSMIGDLSISISKDDDLILVLAIFSICFSSISSIKLERKYRHRKEGNIFSRYLLYNSFSFISGLFSPLLLLILTFIFLSWLKAVRRSS